MPLESNRCEIDFLGVEAVRGIAWRPLKGGASQ
jgi:hypothetical protein